MATHDRELTFTPADFRRVRNMVYRQAGIALSDAKSDMAYARLARRVSAMGEKHFSAYLDSLTADPENPEWQAFINALTTNLTSFFREPHHFNMLAKHWQHHANQAEYRVWSAAASTGEEIYSAAMTLMDTKLNTACRLELLATDIDTHVLKTASEGIYSTERVEPLTEAQLKKYFLRGKGANEGKVRIKRTLRSTIQFKQLNLVAEHWPDIGLFDVIFCRNVMIYFDAPTQKAILHQLAQQMKPHALLFLGHSENIQHITDILVPCGRTTYRRAR